MKEKVDLKQALENIFPNIVKEQCTFGERWRLNDTTCFYSGDEHEQWIAFKDESAYRRSSNEACYMSLTQYPRYIYEVKRFVEEYLDSKMTLKDLCESINNCNNRYSISSQYFSNLCNGQKSLSDYLFSKIKNESPDTLLFKMYRNKQIDDYKDIHVLTNGMDVAKQLYIQYKLDWIQGHMSPALHQTVMQEFDSYHRLEDPMISIEDYLNEFGFHGECYGCFDEFLNNEFQDEDFIKTTIINHHNNYLDQVARRKADPWMYQILNRYMDDCKLFLQNPVESNLFGQSIENHIDMTIKEWKRCPDNRKPQWLSLQDIEHFKTKMETLRDLRNVKYIDLQERRLYSIDDLIDLHQSEVREIGPNKVQLDFKKWFDEKLEIQFMSYEAYLDTRWSEIMEQMSPEHFDEMQNIFVVTNSKSVKSDFLMHYLSKYDDIDTYLQEECDIDVRSIRLDMNQEKDNPSLETR